MSDWTVGCSATVTVDDDGFVSVSVHLEDLAGDVGEAGATTEEEAAVSAWLDRNGSEHRIRELGADGHRPTSLRNFEAGGQWTCSCGSSGTTSGRPAVDGFADHAPSVMPPSSPTWCWKCGHPYEDGLPTCECAGDPPIQRHPVGCAIAGPHAHTADYAAYLRRVAALRHTPKSG